MTPTGRAVVAGELDSEDKAKPLGTAESAVGEGTKAQADAKPNRVGPEGITLGRKGSGRTFTQHQHLLTDIAPWRDGDCFCCMDAMSEAHSSRVAGAPPGGGMGATDGGETGIMRRAMTGERLAGEGRGEAVGAAPEGARTSVAGVDEGDVCCVEWPLPNRCGGEVEGAEEKSGGSGVDVIAGPI